MKFLFLIFHGFNKSNGISKKIHYQIKALKNLGIDTQLCWIDDKENHKYRMIDNKILEDYGDGINGKILKRIEYKSLFNFIKKENITHIYMRSDHNANPILIAFIKKIKNLNIKIVMEIPTYPYDHEYKNIGWKHHPSLWVDKLFRKQMVKNIDRIITFSDHDTIWERPTIKIANGIDFDEVKITKSLYDKDTINLIAVAYIHPWHGFDRAIMGMIKYQKLQEQQSVILHIVGDGIPSLMAEFRQLILKNGLSDHVILHGPLYGNDLDNLFDICQVGIGSLARHRSGIINLKSLKNREYAARGIPFVYSEIDDDFETMPYIKKVEMSDSALEINDIINFYKNSSCSSNDIRDSIINKLSWEVQMSKIINQL